MAAQTHERSRPRVIKRYGNRKLYDVQRSRYITLNGIRDLVQAGEDIRVVDNDTGKDLTAVTFAQIIYEGAKSKDGGLSLPLLRWLVERGDEAMRDVMRSVERGVEAFESMREATERRVQKLVERGDKGRRVIEDLLTAPQRRFDELQHRIDAQVRRSVKRVTRNPTIRAEVKRIERSIRQLEKRLASLRRDSSGSWRPPRQRKR